MAKLMPLLAGKEIDNAAEDFRGAQRIEQYRIGERALYIPAGLRWNYIPLSAVTRAEEAHRVISSGKCVSVELKRPTLQLTTEAGPFSLNLENPESLRKLLALLGAGE